MDEESGKEVEILTTDDLPLRVPCTARPGSSIRTCTCTTVCTVTTYYYAGGGSGGATVATFYLPAGNYTVTIPSIGTAGQVSITGTSGTVAIANSGIDGTTTAAGTGGTAWSLSSSSYTYDSSAGTTSLAGNAGTRTATSTAGTQAASVYNNKGKGAYWDGTNTVSADNGWVRVTFIRMT